MIDLHHGKIVPRNRWRTVEQARAAKALALSEPLNQAPQRMPADHGLCDDPGCGWGCGLLRWFSSAEDAASHR